MLACVYVCTCGTKMRVCMYVWHDLARKCIRTWRLSRHEKKKEKKNKQLNKKN